jgi:hypothetical protein
MCNCEYVCVRGHLRKCNLVCTFEDNMLARMYEKQHMLMHARMCVCACKSKFEYVN